MQNLVEKKIGELIRNESYLDEAEKDQFNQTRLQMGLGQEKFSYPVAPGEQLIAPEVIMSFSADVTQNSIGLANMTTTMRKVPTVCHNSAPTFVRYISMKM